MGPLACSVLMDIVKEDESHGLLGIASELGFLLASTTTDFKPLYTALQGYRPKTDQGRVQKDMLLEILAAMTSERLRQLHLKEGYP